MDCDLFCLFVHVTLFALIGILHVLGRKNGLLLTVDAVIEAKGEEKPALAAEWLVYHRLNIPSLGLTSIEHV